LFRVHGAGFRVQGVEFRVQGAEFRVQGGAGLCVTTLASNITLFVHGVDVTSTAVGDT
jgi:hypothetical protein